MLAYLGRGSDWITCDRDARSKYERRLCGTDDTVARECAEAVPVDGVRRSVIDSDDDPRVRILPLDLFDSSLNRGGRALVVEIRMAVMRVRGGRRRGHGDSRRQNPQIQISCHACHAGGLHHTPERVPVGY